MLEKPNISNKLIISCLQEEYNLHIAELTFLPIGADSRTAVYRVLTQDGTAYFLKLRKNFKEIIVPFETKANQHWADFSEYKLILYPFIEGKDGFERELTDHHRQTLGAAFKGIHTA